MSILLYILVGLLGILIGIFVGRKMKKNDGMFIIDDSDGEITRWMIDMKEEPKEILNKKEVRLSVKIMNGDV